jgi:hypothetical protein
VGENTGEAGSLSYELVVWAADLEMMKMMMILLER